jgi:hypothetical protein
MLLPVRPYAFLLRSSATTNIASYMETIVAKLAAPPLTYQFSTPANSANDTDLIFCHFFFANSVMGNTVTWQCINEPEAKAVTFSAALTTAPSTSRHRRLQPHR